jgi:hypothetical protein
VLLNGRAPVYPLTVAYTVSGTAGSADHSLVNGTVTFAAGETRKNVDFLVYADGLTEGDETIVVTLATAGVNAGAKRSQVVTIHEGNAVPSVALQAVQNGAATVVVGRNVGPVVVTAAVQDADTGNTHSFDWAGTSNSLVDSDGVPGTFTFDPAGLTPGLYELRVKVMDNGSPSASATTSLFVRVVDTLPVLGATDSDGDGIADNVEGFGDSDGDGIPDYLDAVNAANVLPEMAVDRLTYLIECQPGVACRVGANALRGESGGTRLTDNDFAQGIVSSRDPDFSNVGGIFDFSARLAQAGQSMLIAIPQRAAIPANAVYRKQGADGKWRDFVSNNANRLFSAPGQPGYCPPPGDAAWRAGLNAGDWCVQLELEDGGPNDADGEANASVVDPGGVGTARSVNYETSGGGKKGGGGGAAGIELLGLLGLAGLGLTIQRRRAAARALIPMLLSVAAGTALLPESARAETQHDYYVSLRAGAASTDASRGELERRFAKQGVTASVSDVDGDRAGYGITFGYQVGERWAVELGYLDLGDVDLKFSANSTDFNLARVHPESGDGITAGARYRHPLGAGFSAQVRAGVFAWEGDYRTSRDGIHVDANSESGIDPYLGIGVAYEVMSHFDVDLEFQRFEFDRQPTDFISVGVQYRFCL